MRKIHLLKEPSLIAKYDAFQYQKEAFEAVKDLEYAAIFHEQGLGKTKIAIDILLYGPVKIYAQIYLQAPAE